MQVPFVDLSVQYAGIKDETDEAIHRVLESTSFVGGDAVSSFEQNFASYIGTRHAVGVGNGTDALHIALRALDIGHGDEVITVPHTFIATAAAIAMAGAKPVFVDIDPDTYTIDASKIEAAITPRTKAIVPVHLYGQPADILPILELAAKWSLFVIEDAAQSHGAKYEEKRVGSLGHIACFSFYPGKNLGAFGDGGAITTNDDQVAERIMRLRDHGRTSKYEHVFVGLNSRLDAIQATVLDIKLRHLDRWNQQRQKAAAWYDSKLSRMGIQTPLCRHGSTHVYHLYVIETDNRSALQENLNAAGIASGVHYPVPLHLQPAFAHLGYVKGDFPHTERAAQRVLSLPMFPELTFEQMERVVAAASVSEPSTGSIVPREKRLGGATMRANDAAH
jgi:dTDP-4-amino-4,6-dideoxygalactose transaminase